MPMTPIEIERALKQLRLSGIRQTLEARALQAAQCQMAFLDVFTLLLQDELDRRRSKLIERRLSSSGLERRVTLDEFDWGYNPKLPKKACFELLTLKFVGDGEDALLIGHPGTGKSHIAQAVAHAAILAGYKVVCRHADLLFPELFQAAQLKARQKLMDQFLSADLLVIDDLFLARKFPAEAADDFQEIVTQRYRSRKTTMITSNRVIQDWGKFLGDNAMTSALLDRLMHRGHFLRFDGKSWRLKEASARLAKANRD